MHTQAITFLEYVSRAYKESIGNVLEYGSRYVNGSARQAFQHKGIRKYHGIDLVAGRDVDEVADATAYRPTFTPDLIVCAEVLEHCHRWRAIVANAWKTLPPRGILALTCATDPRAPHSADGAGGPGIGEHYANIAPCELLALFPYPNWSYARLDRLPAGDLQLLAVK